MTDKFEIWHITRAGHLGGLTSLDDSLLRQLEQWLAEQGQQGWEMLAFKWSSEVVETFDMHGNPFRGRSSKWQAVGRQETPAVRWEYRVIPIRGDAQGVTVGSHFKRDLDAIRQAASDRWIVVGYTSAISRDSIQFEGDEMSFASDDTLIVFKRRTDSLV